MYYFLEDVYPLMSGRRWLKTPVILHALFHDEVEVIQPVQTQAMPAAAAPNAAVPQQQNGNHFPAPGVVPPPPGFNQGMAASLNFSFSFSFSFSLKHAAEDLSASQDEEI